MSSLALGVAVGALLIALVSSVAAIGVWRSSRRVAEAAEESARVAAAIAARGRESVEELVRSRIDAAAPRVSLSDLHLDWPPYVAAPPSDGLFASPGLWRRLPADELIVLPRDEGLDLYVICRGVLRNDGASAGRVSFTERVLVGARVDGSESGQLIESFVLEAGRSVPVVFPIRRKIPAWATDHPASRPFVRFSTADVRADGPVDSTMVFVDATPLRPVPGMADTYSLVPDGPRRLAIKEDPRRYRVPPADRGVPSGEPAPPGFGDRLL